MEKTILSNLLNNEDYSRKVLPFLKPEYFKDRTEEILFKAIANIASSFGGWPLNVVRKIGLFLLVMQ